MPKPMREYRFNTIDGIDPFASIPDALRYAQEDHQEGVEEGARAERERVIEACFHHGCRGIPLPPLAEYKQEIYAALEVPRG